MTKCVQNKWRADAYDRWARWMYLKYCLKSSEDSTVSAWLHKWRANKWELRGIRIKVGKLAIKKCTATMQRILHIWVQFVRFSTQRKSVVRRSQAKRGRKCVLRLISRWRQYIATRSNNQKINVWQSKQKESNLLMSSWAFWVFVTSTHSKAVSQISKALQISARTLFRNTIYLWYNYTKSKKRCNCIAVLVVLRGIKRQTSEGWQRWLAVLLSKKHLNRVEDKIRAADRRRTLLLPFGLEAWKGIAEAARYVAQSCRKIELKQVRGLVRSLVRFWQRWADSRRAGRKIAWLLRSWAVTLQRRRKERSKLLGAMNTSLKSVAPIAVPARDPQPRQRKATTPRFSIADYGPEDARSVPVSPARSFAAF